MKKNNSIKISVINYKGWENSVEIVNDNVKMVVVPSIGRIMYFGDTEGHNVLWNNEKFLGQNIEYTEELFAQYFWANYGGDKVWCVEQDDFPKTIKRTWPPDETFDGGNFEYQLLPNGVKITSQVSKYTKTRLIREITADASSKKFKIAQTIVCEGDSSSVPATIWNVSQALPPEKIVVDHNKASIFDGGIKYFYDKFDPKVELFDNKMFIDYIDTDTLKIGMDSKRFLAAIWKDKIFVQSFHHQKDKKYPDGGCPVEVLLFPEFTEMELLSPLKMLRKGEKLQFDIEWTLKDIKSDKKEDIAPLLNQIIEED